MEKFEIIVGSVLGASEYVADALKETLEKAAVKTVNIHLQPELSELDQTSTWLVCTSTHGAGDLPDNIQPFAEQLADQTLAEVSFLVVGLGDSSYDTFCFGSMQMQLSVQKILCYCLFSRKSIQYLTHDSGLFLQFQTN